MQNRPLLATMTNEPFQPVRLYYRIPDRAFAIEKLRRLKSMSEVPPENCWQWLFRAEAASLPIGAGYNAVPLERQPIILGRIRFPKNGSMTFQTNSFSRAVAAARFFALHLGPEILVQRCRVVNRWFAADEGHLDSLMNTLDQNVVVIDPREAESAFRRDFSQVRTMEEAEHAAAESMRHRLASKEDVPLVEDFPLYPEEETPEFTTLGNTLGVRFIRASEHWKGNTDMTLSAIIVRTVEDGIRRGIL